MTHPLRTTLPGTLVLAVIGATLVIGPLARADAGGGLSYTEWKDPIQGAFTMQVAKGWKVTGGAYQFAPIDVRLQVDAGSPDGATHVQVGDASLTTYAVPGPSSRVRGLHEGQSYEVNGVTYTVLHLVSGEQFSRLYVESRLTKELAGLKIGTTRDRPDIATTLGQPLLKGATLGETEFTFTRGGHEMQGACYARIEPNAGIFSASTSVVLAPPTEMETATGVLLHMAGHTKPDAQWQAKMTRVAGEFTDKVLHHHAEAMAELHADYEKCISRINATAALWKPVLNPPGH